MTYAEAWREHRRLWKHFLLWWVGGPLLVGLLTVVGSVVLQLLAAPPAHGRWLDALALLGAGVWGVGTAVRAMLLFYGFKCPRCRRLFYLRGVSGNAWTGRCLNCGLRKNAAEPFVASVGVAPLRLPLFILSKELRVFTSVHDAERYLLRPEVWAEAGFDSAGLRLQLQEWTRGGLFGMKSERVLLDRGEARPTGQARLKQLLEAALQARGASREWIERASLDELVQEAARQPERP